MPLREVRALARRLPQREAERDLRLLTIITFPNWSGDSSNHKQALREGNRKRRHYLQDLQRQARGLGRFDQVDGVDVLRSSSDIRAWFGAHGIDAEAA